MATILGKAVTFQDCFVLDTPFSIAQPLYKLGLETGVSVTLPRGSETIISWAACYPESAVVVTDVGIFHTSNGFLTTAEIKFPVGLIDPSMIHSIKEVAIVFPNVFILIQNILYEASVGTITNVGDNYFHRVDIIGIRAKTWCSDYSGNAIIKLKNNALFFFKFQTTDVVKLTAWENNLTRFIFYFNPSGDMYLLTINNTNINRKVYPLNLEVLSAASKLNEVCPYISFEHNLNLDIHYIDRRENVTFWGQIVFLENLGLSTDVKIYRPELLLTEIHINYEIARGICTKNKTVTFYEARDTSLYDYQEEL
ncbi:cation channel sperm-associated auxiliary subunit epsilon [Candoia aspera]|uniref:cation channel sperm-associated auxiliary subunit epsilon n=1 Tax=Candoia aspera TaxID=51853 RepID=UPI002FD8609F